MTRVIDDATRSVIASGIQGNGGQFQGFERKGVIERNGAYAERNTQSRRLGEQEDVFGSIYLQTRRMGHSLVQTG